MKNEGGNYLLALLRISLGLIFLWAFLDKLFGLGINTTKDKAWIYGVSPTYGFLSNNSGLFSQFFKSLAGLQIIDWFFMLGLLLIGLSLILGIGVRIAGYSGALLMFFMWLASLPLEHHPFIDEHIIYLLLFILFTVSKAGYTLGFGKIWSKTKLVKKYNIMK